MEIILEISFKDSSHKEGSILHIWNQVVDGKEANKVHPKFKNSTTPFYKAQKSYNLPSFLSDRTWFCIGPKSCMWHTPNNDDVSFTYSFDLSMHSLTRGSNTRVINGRTTPHMNLPLITSPQHQCTLLSGTSAIQQLFPKKEEKRERLIN